MGCGKKHGENWTCDLLVVRQQLQSLHTAVLSSSGTWWRNPHQGCDISPKTQDLGHGRCDWLWVLLMFTTARFSIRPLLYHTAPTPPPHLFLNSGSVGEKKKNATRCLMFNLVIYFLAGGAQSENRALYFTKNLDYVITRLLTFTPTKPSSDGWNTKNLFLCATWRTQSEFWACCMGARALSLRQAFLFIFFRQAGRHPGEDEEYFSVTGKYRPHC